MSAQSLSPDDFDRLAAEHVLGLLGADEDSFAETLLASDPLFRAAVDSWRQRFAELDTTALPLEAPDALLQRITATLDTVPAAPQSAAEQSISQPDIIVGTRTPAVPPPPAALLPPIPHPAGAFAALWRSLGFWRSAGFAGAAATVLLALGVTIGPLGKGPAPTFVAVLMSPQGEPAAVVNAFANGTAELIPLRTIAVPEGRTLEVWTLWDPARGPVSLGLSGEARTIRLDLKNLPRTAPDQLFEITLEPKGGSPIGRPTGPVLMKGTTSVAL